MKQFTMIVKHCSQCPNAYVEGTEDNGGRYYKCSLINGYVGTIDGAVYDADKDEWNHDDAIPTNCPLQNAL